MHSALLKRQLTGGRVLRQSYLPELSCSAPGAGTIQVNTLNGLHGSPPFCAQYNLVDHGRRYLGIADEEGYISVVDTTAPLPEDIHLVEEGCVRPRAQWEAHKNAIFDFAWAKGDLRMLTASGDQSVALWDTLSARRVSAFHGHAGSVKSVCPMPACHDVFASGARDGAVLLWDARVPSENASRSCVLKVQDAHVPHDEWLRTPRKRKLGRSTSHFSVTSVLFLRTDHVLVTAGAVDGVVKFWDVRKFGTPAAFLVAGKREKLQCLTSQRTARSARPFGVISLAQDPAGTRLLVSATNNQHQLFSALHPEQSPSAVFEGHIAGSFYVRACFSGCGRHILSGSSDAAVYIWEVDRPEAKPVVLRGHAREVTGVAWCPTDPLQLATCGDDASVRVWALARRQLSHSPQAGRGPPCAEAGHLRADMAPPTPVLAARLRVSGAAPATAPAAGAQRLVGSPDGRAGVMSPQRAPFTPRVPDAQLPAAAAAGDQGRPATTGGKLAQRSIREFFSPPAGERPPRRRRAVGGNGAPMQQENRTQPADCAQPAEQGQAGEGAAGAGEAGASGCTVLGVRA